jgi:hypothetical protein
MQMDFAEKNVGNSAFHVIPPVHKQICVCRGCILTPQAILCSSLVASKSEIKNSRSTYLKPVNTGR